MLCFCTRNPPAPEGPTRARVDSEHRRRLREADSDERSNLSGSLDAVAPPIAAAPICTPWDSTLRVTAAATPSLQAEPVDERLVRPVKAGICEKWEGRSAA